MYQVISTFSGIGGSSQGYKQAGLKVLASVEFLDYQAANYRLNHPGTKVYQSDIRTLEPLAILAELGLRPGDLDVLDGSPPCSSFSTNGIVADGWGKVKQYGNREQRTDDLFFEYIRFLEAMQPKTFVAENVSGLIKGVSKGYFNQFFEAFESAGYKVSAKLLNAANYEVPQIRQRIIFVGVRCDLGLNPVFPQPFGKIITASEAIRAYQIDKSEDVSISDLQREYWNMTQPGQSMEDANFRKTGRKGWFSKMKLHPLRPANTITAHAGDDLFHWKEPRHFYTDELKALQSFPNDYRLEGSRIRCTEGVGRSVPPKMMEAIARTLAREVLDKIR
ncbi:DNA cytosine methyltransferase [Larkinella terrae]|nr:DNA cytosine methyltransferase [Larkinella terrae]